MREAKEFLEKVQQHGIRLSADSLERLEAQRAAHHRAWMRLGWFAIITLIGAVALLGNG